MPFDFTDKRVLITGGTRGIGRATVAAFLESGARVAVNGRTAASTTTAIAALGNSAKLVPAPGNVATEAGCRAIVDLAISGLGKLDILVNCAGIGDGAAIEDVSEAFWDEMLAVNLKGAFFCTRWALEALRERKGNVVNLASDAGLIGDVGAGAVYCASKGGLVNMTRAMALELAPDVRVNCVCPGYVDTDMVRRDIIEKSDDPVAVERALIAYAPLKRIAEPKEIAAAILYLASDDARYVTGAAFQIDGGTTAGR